MSGINIDGNRNVVDFEESEIQTKITRYVWLAICLISVLMLRQLGKEIFMALVPLFRYLIADTFYGKFFGLLQRLTHLPFYNPLLHVKIVYASIHFAAIFGSLWFWFQNKSYLKFTTRIFLTWFGFALLLNIIGRTLGSQNVTDDGRGLLDLLLYPFALAFMIPVLYLKKYTEGKATVKGSDKQ